MKQVVNVFSKSIEITVRQKNKTVWIASGNYLGELIQAQGRTVGAAIKSWRDAARYRGN